MNGEERVDHHYSSSMDKMLVGGQVRFRATVITDKIVVVASASSRQHCTLRI